MIKKCRIYAASGVSQLTKSVKEEERVDKKTENPVEELLDPEKSIGNEKKKKSEKKYLKRNKQKKKKGKVRKHDHGES